MTRRDINLRNSRIIRYRLIEGHTVEQTAKKFNLSLNQIFLIQRKYKDQHGV